MRSKMTLHERRSYAHFTADVSHARITVSGKSDVETLMTDLLPFAEKMLREHREFLPFGGHMKPDGVIVWEGAKEAEEGHPPSQSLIDILLNAHRQLANARQIKACATLYDVRVVPPNGTEKQDAIAVSLDHQDGYSVVVFFPYSFGADGELNVEGPFASEGQRAVFEETRG